MATELGMTGVEMPPVVFGTSCLGNLYKELPWETKLGILREIFTHSPEGVVLDSAGKYGAGLALEIIGKGLRELGIPREKVLISNKLGWMRAPLRSPEPTFEPGVWAALEHDAEQCISYTGILRCYAQGRELLGEPYLPQLVSVHDPDEYLARSVSSKDYRHRLGDILQAYRALKELKRQGKVAAIGVGAKDWTVIRQIAKAVELDWVMLACSLTVMQHPPELLSFIDELKRRGVGIINSAVFHSGFLTGGDFFDYRKVDPRNPGDQGLFAWREKFQAVCAKHEVAPAAACVQFGMSIPGVLSTALNTGKISHVKENIGLVRTQIPTAFWVAMKDQGLISRAYPYLG